jgi:hypothetical protein
MSEDRLTTQEAAALLDISKELFWHRVRRGLIAPISGGGRGRDCYWSRSELIEKHDVLCRVPVRPFDRQPSALDCAYLAGFLDGEGCIDIALSKRARATDQHYIRVAATNTDPEVIAWIAETFGGAGHLKRKAVPPRRACYLWVCSTTRAYHVLKLLLPHMKTKRRQAELAIEFQERLFATYGERRGRFVSDDECQYRDRIKQAISALNQRR